MNDTYVECLVARQTKPVMKFLKYLLISLTVLVGLFALMIGSTLFIIVAIAIGVGAYFASTNSDIEYEYLYVDKQISVDKVFGKARRKTVAKYDVEKLEIMAPINSHQLDSFKNRTFKLADYSSNMEKQPDPRYVFFYDGQTKVIFEPSPEFVKAVYQVSPRKVFEY